MTSRPGEVSGEGPDLPEVRNPLPRKLAPCAERYLVTGSDEQSRHILWSARPPRADIKANLKSGIAVSQPDRSLIPDSDRVTTEYRLSGDHFIRDMVQIYSRYLSLLSLQGLYSKSSR